MFITFISIVVLSFLFTKYLYRLMYVQKVLKVFLPKDIYRCRRNGKHVPSSGVSMSDEGASAASADAGNKKNNAPAAEAPKNNA